MVCHLEKKKTACTCSNTLYEVVVFQTLSIALSLGMFSLNCVLFKDILTIALHLGKPWEPSAMDVPGVVCDSSVNGSVQGGGDPFTSDWAQNPTGSLQNSCLQNVRRTEANCSGFDTRANSGQVSYTVKHTCSKVLRRNWFVINIIWKVS